MGLSRLTSDRQFRWLFIGLAVAGVFYLIVNIAVLGGDEFVFSLNSFLVSPLAILTTLMAAILWRKMKVGYYNRLLWGGLLWGWVCWSVAESLWAAYSLMGQDPYPSPADVFFALGYVPMVVGFISRLRGLPVKFTLLQRALIGLISVIVILATVFFILVPILQEYDPGRFFESLLGVFYPLADLLLLLLALNIFFTYGAGDYAWGWRLILLGFITVTVSDLFYAYADWNGLYYPDLQANLISTLAVDVLYSASYVLWALGIYVLGILLREHHAFKINLTPSLVPSEHVFLFIRKDGVVVDVSRNYYSLFPLDDVQNKMLGQCLGTTGQTEDTIQEQLREKRVLTDFPLRFRNRSGVLQEGWLCGLATMDSPDDYGGAVLILRTFLEGRESDEGLSEYQRSILPFVMARSNSSEKSEIRRLMLDYYLAYIQSLFNLIFREGGAAMSQSLLDELRSLALKNGWSFQFSPQSILDDSGVSLETLKEALPAFLAVTRRFASLLTDPVTVENQMLETHSQIEDAVHQSVARLRKSNGAAR